MAAITLHYVMGNLPTPGMAAVVGTVCPKIIIGMLSVFFKRLTGDQRYCCKCMVQGDGTSQGANLLFNYFNLNMPVIKARWASGRYLAVY